MSDVSLVYLDNSKLARATKITKPNQTKELDDTNILAL